MPSFSLKKEGIRFVHLFFASSGEIVFFCARDHFRVPTKAFSTRNVTTSADCLLQLRPDSGRIGISKCPCGSSIESWRRLRSPCSVETMIHYSISPAFLSTRAPSIHRSSSSSVGSPLGRSVALLQLPTCTF